jgi:hypothetical protein
VWRVRLGVCVFALLLLCRHRGLHVVLAIAAALLCVCVMIEKCTMVMCAPRKGKFVRAAHVKTGCGVLRFPYSTYCVAQTYSCSSP